MTAVMILQVGRVDSEPVSNAGLLMMLGVCLGYGADVARKEQTAPVSYTHLTLPTSDLV